MKSNIYTNVPRLACLIRGTLQPLLTQDVKAGIRTFALAAFGFAYLPLLLGHLTLIHAWLPGAMSAPSQPAPPRAGGRGWITGMGAPGAGTRQSRMNPLTSGRLNGTATSAKWRSRGRSGVGDLSVISPLTMQRRAPGPQERGPVCGCVVTLPAQRRPMPTPCWRW